MRSKKLILQTLLFFAISGTSSLHAVDLTQNFNFDGYLLNASSVPISGPVGVNFQIYNSSGTCLLYDETYSAVSPAADGAVSLKIGAGARNTVADGGNPYKSLFQNDTPVAGLNCGTFTPISGEQRRLRVTVGGTVLTPDYSMSAVPMATVAESLQGKVPSDFMAAKPYSLPAADGASSQVMQTNGAGVLSWVSPAAGGITSLNSLTAAAQTFSVGTASLLPSFSSAGSIHTLDIPLASTAGVTAGLISKTDYDNFNSKMSLAGGTMTGSLVLNADPAVPLGAATKQYVDSKVLANGTALGNTMVWNGSAWVESNFLNISSTGIVSVTAGHTVTAGNNVADKDYVDTAITAAGGLSSTLPSGNIYVGNASNVATPVSMGGDATMSNTGAVTLNVGAVNSSKILDSSITTADLANASVTFAKIDGVACVANQVMKWNGTSWTCAADDTGAGSTTVAKAGDLMTGALSFGSTGAGMFSPGPANHVAIQTFGAERMRFDNAGNVGIGTTAPGNLLDIQGNVASGAVNAQVTNTNSTGASLISAGSVGVGTLSLESHGSGSLYGANAVGDARAPSSGALYWSGSNPLAIAAAGVAADIRIYTGGDLATNERMRITSAGNVGIGTISPTNKLDVIGNANISGTLSAVGGINSNGPSIFTGPTTIGSTGTSIVEVKNYASQACSIASVPASGGTANCTITIGGLISPSSVALNCRPDALLPSGLVSDCYVSSGNIVIRLTNVTGTLINTSIPPNWSVTVTKF